MSILLSMKPFGQGGDMFVYRVEHKKTGIGPYLNNGQDWEPIGLKMHDPPTHQPAPCHDGLESFAGAEYLHFGFSSYAQLVSWFGEHFAKLREYGYVIVIYKTKKKYVERGYRQVAFLKSRSNRVRLEETPIF